MEENDEKKNLEGQDGDESKESQESQESVEPSETPVSTERTEPTEPTEPEITPLSEIESEDEEDRITVGEVARKWGLYVGLIGIVYGLIQQFAGLATSNVANYLGSVILIAGVVLAHKEFKRDGNGFMSFKQGFGIGSLITIYSSLISVVFTYVYIKFVDDSMMTMIKEQQIEQMENRGMSEAEIEQAMEFTSSFMTPEVTMVFALIGSIVIGIILSLIISAITKNEDPSVEI